MTTGELIAGAFLSLLLFMTIFCCHETGMETSSINQYIRAEVAEQLRQKTVPIVHGKYVSVYNGVEMEVVEK